MQYGLIGEKLSHSFSKDIHEKLAPYTYELCEIQKNELAGFLQKREFCAINVTMPYKKEVIPHLDWVSDIARQLDAVNTIVNRNGKLYGYNTDYYGMRDLIIKLGAELKNKKVLILGTGGTSRTSALVAKDLGASETVFVSREQRQNAVTYDQAYSLHSDASIIINATPVGMYPEPYSSPIDTERFSSLEAVVDAVYNPLRTALVCQARANKIKSEAGLYMLVSQAVYAVELFLDKKIEHSLVDNIFNEILRSKENIVLIGMPSCGKTTVGKILSEKMSRPLYDLDDEIEKRMGCTIAEFFEDHSEKDFRNIESEVTKEISKKTGIIIATGGGCATKLSNVNTLRSNGRLYFLDRSVKNLTPTYSRPLARRPGDIENLHKLRYSIYCSVCDHRINGDLDPQEEADLIIKEFYQEI